MADCLPSNENTQVASSTRIVLPELLDELSPDDPRARHSRQDLKRIHRVMGSLSILIRALDRLKLEEPPRRILELGAGDGSLMLRLAKTVNPPWRNVSLTLLDRHELVDLRTRAAFRALGWELTVRRDDALAWAADPSAPAVDLCITTLFLHHFDSEALALVLQGVANTAAAFIACEPRRSRVARLGSHLVGLVGANRVTREDAVKSVIAGFQATELTALWPATGARWTCEEYPARPFTHCFVAARGERSHG